MAVYVNNITIDTGAYFSKDFYLDNIDGSSLNLAGYAASSYVRKHPASLNTAAKFDVGFVDRDNGQIRLSLSSDDTAKIKPGRYVYDVLTTVGVGSTAVKTIIIEGSVLAREDITPKCIVTNYDNSEVGIIPENNTPSSGGITYSQVTSYGAVHIGVKYNQCSSFSANPVGAATTGHLLDDLKANSNQNLNILKTYLNNGGVVWFNAEWWNGNNAGEGCSNKDNINEILTLLGTSIRADSDIGTTGSTVLSSNTAVQNSGLPATQTQDASVTFTGGTPVYITSPSFTGTNNDGDAAPHTLTAYEKIGSGVLYVSGDSNSNHNANNFNGTDDAIYNGLRYLVINS